MNCNNILLTPSYILLTPSSFLGNNPEELIVESALITLVIMLLILSIPFFLAGWGVFKKRNWGAVLAVIAGILNLTSIPLGTALGIHTFWVVYKRKITAR